MKRLVFDVECDGFDPSMLFCIGIHDLDADTYKHYVLEDIPLGLMEIADADLLIGHNIRKFDLPVIKRLTEGLVDIPDDRIIDTLEMSRELFPDMPNHKLGTWGTVLGYPKLDWKKFDRFYPEMVPYMDRDVEINVWLFRYFELICEEQHEQMLLERAQA